MLRITLINDDEVIARGVASMLHDHVEHLELVSLNGPILEAIDIALYDSFGSPRDPGSDIARLLADARIRKVVIYTSNFQPWLATDLLEQGASGYLSKSLPSDQLVAALTAINEGHVVVAPQPTHATEGNWPGHESGLTEREAEVLSLISMGLSNDDIADQLALSINSVKSYIRSAYRKIDVDSRTQAVLWSVANGLRTDPLPDAGLDPTSVPETRQSHETTGLGLASGD
ncbi:MAG: response regulator transcription factor [Nocardioides sp.]|uniref:response regulator transcription factor n=1 Tax=Nocardioides sp. TaxID=35761 RepID=UPI003267FC0A